jgi:hypothetical protein
MPEKYMKTHELREGDEAMPASGGPWRTVLCLDYHHGLEQVLFEDGHEEFTNYKFTWIVRREGSDDA